MPKKTLFEEFKDECSRWQEFFGLLDWEIEYRQKQTCADKDDAYGDILRDMEARSAIITLYISKTRTIEQAKATAFHEVCHLLLGDLGLLAQHRYVNEKTLDRTEEAIIRRLENSVYKSLKG